MITEDYCSFEVSKLLKEKGFDGMCYCHEFTDYKGNFTTYHTEYPENWNQSDPCVSIPTLGMAMKWLREIHKLHITILWDCGACIGKNSFCYHIDRIDNYEDKGYNKIGFDSNEDAVEAALKYVLENLI